MKKCPAKLIQKNPFLLAPMDDVTDIAFRELCEERGASYSTTELTSVEALIRNRVPKSRYERGNLKVNSVQLFGRKPENFVEGAKVIYNEADFIDVNFGCPSATVTGNEGGSFLLKDPKNTGEIINKLVKNIDKPITAKIRLGYKKNTYLEVAKEIEDAGATLITVHGRTAEQKYSGKANWDAIREIKEKLKIPVVGNGDIKSESDINSRLPQSASALMIGRAAIGNPLIFERFKYYYKNQKLLEIEDYKKKQKELFIQYLNKLSEHEFRNTNIKIQKQAMWFMKGIEGAKKLRTEIASLKNPKPEIVIKLVEDF